MTETRTYARRPDALSRIVGENVRLLRAGQRITTRQLSDLLADRGCRIVPSNLNRMERHGRLITVDELAAFGEVFQAEPWSLTAALSMCAVCFGRPPAGFTCNSCGSDGAS